MPKNSSTSADPRILSRAAQRKIGFGLLLVPLFYGLLLLLTAACFAAAGALTFLTVHFMIRTHTYILAGTLFVPAIATIYASFLLLRATAMSFRKPSIFIPAIWINPERETDLTRFLTAVCTDMGVPFPNAIVLHVSTSFFMSRYPMSVLNANPRGYILGLSLPLLSALTINELRAIVAHEFAHFSGGDMKYSRRVLPVYTAIGETARLLYEINRQNRYGLIAHLFLQIPMTVLHLFGRQFERLNLSLSREQESRADAVSASICGRESFASAMRKVVGYGFAYNEMFPKIMEELHKSNQPDINAYRTFRKRLKEFQPIAQKGLAMQMVDYSDAWDQHPTLIRRIESLPPYPERYSDHAPALSLFKQYAGYEGIAHRFMENEYRIYLAQTR